MVSQPPRSWDLRITTDHRETFTILTLSGRISGRTADLLRQAIQGSGETAALLVDLSGVDYVSSAGLSVFREAADGRKLILCVSPGSVQIALDLAGLPPYVAVELSLGPALERLGPAGGSSLAEEPARADN